MAGVSAIRHPNPCHVLVLASILPAVRMGETTAACGFGYSPDGLFAVAWPYVQ
jgi:hypothetical protein